MNKMSGKKSDFSLIREENSRIVIGYDQKKITGKSLYEWYEVYLNKSETPQLTLKMVKDAIEADINAQTDEEILTGFVWTPEGGEPINVWLSMENQNNYSEAYHIAERKPEAILPVTFKLGEKEDKTPVYHTFETFSELESFYLQGAAFKQATLTEGWQRKDAIDWTPYEALFPQSAQTSNAEE